MADATDPPDLGDKADRFMVQAEAEVMPAGEVPCTERVMVHFEGPGSGVERLSWGQAGLWDAMCRQRSWLPIGGVDPLPPTATVADMAEELRFLMSRHQTLRTRLRLDPDTTRQVVSPTGAVSLEIYDVPDGGDPARVAAHLRHRFSDTDYDVSADWPIRMGVVRHRGVLRYKVVIMCHLVTDGIGASIMLSGLHARGQATGQAPPPDDAMEPQEQARWQQSPAGQRVNDAALRYCRRVLSTVPARRFPEPLKKPSPRYWYASFSSRALYLAVRAIAARTQADTATVLLAAFAMAQVRVSGQDPMMAMVLASNRYRRGLARSVSPITNAVPCSIDVAGAALDEVVARTRGRAMAAYKHSYFDPLAFNNLVDEISRERGEQVDTACYVNDRRMASRDQPAGPPPTPEQIRAALTQTTFEWRLKQDTEPYERFFLHIEDVPDTITISVVLDSHQVSPADAEACLRAMEDAAATSAAPAP